MEDKNNTDLKIKNLRKSFGKNKVLNGINFELTEGESGNFGAFWLRKVYVPTLY